MLKLFEQHNVEFEKKVEHSRTQGTFTRYRTVCNHIREFLPHTYKREDIPLKELNLTFINDFEYFLRTEKNGYPLRNGKEQPEQLCRIYISCSMNYIAKIIRIIVIPIVFHILYFNNLQF